MPGTFDPRSLLERAAAGAALVIDVRSAAAFDRGHIPHAINVPLDELEDRIAGLAEGGANLLFVCAVGRRSAAAQLLAQRHGVPSDGLCGDLAAWTALGYPMTTKELA